MTILLTIAGALATFFLGLYLGHLWGSHDARVEAGVQKRRCRRILRFAEPYIDAHAEAQGWTIDRNEDGEIIDLQKPPIRCGTHVLLMKELLDARRRHTTLH